MQICGKQRALNCSLVLMLVAMSSWVTASDSTKTADNESPNHVHYEKPENYLQPAVSGALAPRLQNLGNHQFPVSTNNEQAQRFVNQGLILSYGFNHAEARRAFAEAARLDPTLAMAYWGQALVLGPNINSPMDPGDEFTAYELIQKAKNLASSPRETSYVAALASRYTGRAEDRSHADKAYAEAMRAHAERYKDDLDARVLFAESLMVLRPWDYFRRDGSPQPETRDIIFSLETALARDPDHPGALHFWIHLFEANEPKRAEFAADRLLPLVPGAGHLVHMPGHIYLRVGRYQDAIEANEKAVLADEDYIAQCRAQGIYPLGYYPHNIHFIWAGASMSGQRQLALQSAQKVASVIPKEALAQIPFLQTFLAVPYHAQIRFGEWQSLIDSPVPNTQFLNAIRHFGRGLAFVRANDMSKANAELSALQRIAVSEELKAEQGSFGYNDTVSIIDIAPAVLLGEIALANEDYAAAIAHLDHAVRLEDALRYNEPPDWPIPTRQFLGAALLKAERAREAEAVYWEDLRRNPENGWSLRGLQLALAAQGKEQEAQVAQQRFEKAWAKADIQLSSSRL